MSIETTIYVPTTASADERNRIQVESIRISTSSENLEQVKKAVLFDSSIIVFQPKVHRKPRADVTWVGVPTGNISKSNTEPHEVTVEVPLQAGKYSPQVIDILKQRIEDATGLVVKLVDVDPTI